MAGAWLSGVFSISHLMCKDNSREADLDRIDMIELGMDLYFIELTFR